MAKYKWSILFFVLALSYGIYRAISDEKRLESNYGFNNGEIIDVEKYRTSGGRIFVKFELIAGDKTVSGSSAFACDKSHLPFFKKMLVGKKMDVVYEKDNIDNCKMLLNKSDYKKFKFTPSEETLRVLDSIERICEDNDQ